MAEGESGFQVSGRLIERHSPDLDRGDWRTEDEWAFSVCVATDGTWSVKCDLVRESGSWYTTHKRSSERQGSILSFGSFYDGTNVLTAWRSGPKVPWMTGSVRESGYLYGTKGLNILWLAFASGRYIDSGSFLPWVWEDDAWPGCFSVSATIETDESGQFPATVTFAHTTELSRNALQAYNNCVRLGPYPPGDSLESWTDADLASRDEGEVKSIYRVLDTTNTLWGSIPSRFEFEWFLNPELGVYAEVIGYVDTISALPSADATQFRNGGVPISLVDYRFRSKRHRVDSVSYTPNASGQAAIPSRDDPKLKRLFGDRLMSPHYYQPSKAPRVIALGVFLLATAGVIWFFRSRKGIMH